MSLEIWDDDMAEAMEQAEGQQELEEGVLMENIGEMQQELGGLMESFKDFFEGDDISGEPEKDITRQSRIPVRWPARSSWRSSCWTGSSPSRS